MPRLLKIAVLILAIVATLGVSVASASHVDSSPNSCNLCFVAHTVAFETPAAHLIFGSAVIGRASVVVAASNYQPRTGKTSLSRGPPSFV
jgi:hypothetical protein